MTNIAISNLAWHKSEDEKIFELMHNLNIRHLEISPFRASVDPSVNGLLKKLDGYKIYVVALQSLLFRYPELSIFQNQPTRQKIFDHLVKVFKFASEVKAKVLVFGSPKNKIRGTMPYTHAFDIATHFFKKLAKQAKKFNLTLCIEPTPIVYGADFIRNTNEAIDLIKAVDNGSLKLNLDIGSSMLNQERIEEIILRNIKYIGHFHISEPYLETINHNQSFHQSIAQTLYNSAYKGFVSIEMLPNNESNIARVYETLSFIKEIYQKNNSSL